MQHPPVQFHRLLLIACLALVQLFAPLLHAHTGDSRQAGVHMHIPGAGQDGDTRALSTDPGIEIGIDSMRRESGSVTPEPDIPFLLASLPDLQALSVLGTPAVAPALQFTGIRVPDTNPTRAPPAASLR